ncbi:hypothetical protein [Acidovorax sp.]|uniref:hypothetical protein n=1 Tax=Acidovorax sp. TaxID=1872122 RepID=UPI0027B9348C|nr:hypothetical protein [Acidovorax sp.]
MNALVKLLIGLGCVGMYFGWRHVPDATVFGVGLGSFAIYGSLAVVAVGFGLAMVFGGDDAPVQVASLSRDIEECGDLPMHVVNSETYSPATHADHGTGASLSNAPLYDPTFAGVDARYDSFGWKVS